MAKFCTSCGAPLADAVKFCTSCGQVLAQPAPAQPVQPAPQPQAPMPLKPKKKIKPPLLIGGAAALVVLVVVIALLAKPGGPGGDADDGGESITTYEIFGDGDLIKAPQRLQAKASPDDGLSAAALVGPWEGTRSSINTEYGFSDDGYFYKNVMISHLHINSIYHSGYWSYDTYYYGWWENNYSTTYTYLDTLIGEYRVRGGVIEFDHVVAINRTSFEDDWYNAKTRSVSMEQLQRTAKSARMQDDFTVEFEFINQERVRFRDESEDMDLFWDLKDVPHNVKLPKHEIPPVEWPKRALSPDMPALKTKGRIREASLSYSGDNKNIKPEFKTVTVVIDKTDALSEINAYGSSLKKSGWWVEDYELGSEDTSLSFTARNGMFKLEISNGRGSGTSADTIVIESTKYPEGAWPKSWSNATLAPPDKAVIVGDLKAETGVDINLYETVIFDKVNEAGVKAYMDQLRKAGFKKPQYSSNDWECMKYVRIGKELYLAMVRLDKRMDSLTSFTYDLSYVPDGTWPASWKKGGLPAPEGIDTIAGAIDADEWAKSIADYGSGYESIKFLGLDPKGVEAYFSKLKSLGFRQVADEWDDSVRLYNYLRIDGKMLRVEVRPADNEDIAELSFSFQYSEDGKWPDSWKTGGLPAPEGFDTIIGAMDLAQWGESLADYGSGYERVKFLGLDAKETDAYLAKLKSLGFKQVADEWDDSVRLYNYLRIDGKMLRAEVRPQENDELAEFTYDFKYFEDGAWPAAWASAGIPAPSFTAMLGKIDIAEFNESLSDYGSYYASVKLLGANLSDYAAALRKQGFQEPEYSYSDTWELEKRLTLGGKQVEVTIKESENQEVSEISISIRS